MIRIKPHHFVDVLRFLGRGRTAFEPHPYGHAMHAVARELVENRDSVLAIELGADDVCLPCRHNAGGLCDDTIDTSFRPQAPSSKREYNLRIDRRWCERLGLKPGDRIGARDLCRRLREVGDDLADVYCELPPERTAERAAELRAGVEEYLRPG